MNFEVPTEGHLHWTEQEYNEGKKSVLKTIIILAIVTVVEVGAAMIYDKIYPNGGGPKLLLNLFMAVMSVVKVVYIMGIFMHVKHETGWFKRTILLPFLFLVWAIIAFAVDGGSWNAMRQLLNAF
ncbi:MAG: cytochrome C oxidase subunit IV family protein [Chitinophagales bacterium]|nr:cytochrome C oxidase subunit IV family protein [Chitinophagales bacterium]MDW8418190.1 cytochrome C oxidase subunit IV family protein [Chitinophagales bacterium]